MVLGQDLPRDFCSAGYPHFDFCVLYRPRPLILFSVVACIGGGSGTYRLDLDIVRFWRWDLSDAIPVGTMSMTCAYSILSSLLDDSHGEELWALHGVDS